MPSTADIARSVFNIASDYADSSDGYWGSKVTKPEFEVAVAALKLDGSMDRADRQLVKDRFEGADMSRTARALYGDVVAPLAPIPTLSHADKMRGYDSLPVYHKSAVLSGSGFTVTAGGQSVSVPAADVSVTAVPLADLPRDIAEHVEEFKERVYSAWDPIDYNGPIPDYEKHRFDQVIDTERVELDGEHIGWVVRLMPSTLDWESEIEFDEPAALYYDAEDEHLTTEDYGYPV